ncbi:hypothetical protein TNCV_3771851 [Trichonephila clavipes]|nr:hypothetical protein TNCV_3771851 [Trichonephila clavipes]
MRLVLADDVPVVLADDVPVVLPDNVSVVLPDNESILSENQSMIFSSNSDSVVNDMVDCANNFRIHWTFSQASLALYQLSKHIKIVRLKRHVGCTAVLLKLSILAPPFRSQFFRAPPYTLIMY